ICEGRRAIECHAQAIIELPEIGVADKLLHVARRVEAADSQACLGVVWAASVISPTQKRAASRDRWYSADARTSSSARWAASVAAGRQQAPASQPPRPRRDAG